MANIPPTCSTCGSVLAGYERNKELDTFVYFCFTCRRAEEKAAWLKEQEKVARISEVPKAA